MLRGVRHRIAATGIAQLQRHAVSAPVQCMSSPFTSQQSSAPRDRRLWSARPERGPGWVAVARLEDDRARALASHRAIATWLFTVAALVVVIIGVGGATRLTGSGLSITEWSPILGAIPPLSDTDWQMAFAKYRTIPQYQLVNTGMSLDAFKSIYWWEWGHRQLGRVIGLAYVLPLLGFLIAGRIPRRFILPLLIIGPLIGLQGAVGWFMVQSGFSANQIAVSPYRLTLHLALAFAVLGALLWQALKIQRGARDSAPAPAEWTAQPTVAGLLVAGLYLQIILGGFVAGTRAGLTYNSWPLMDGALVPAGLGILEPWYRNLTENITTVQFDHRVLAYVVALLAIGHALAILHARHRGRTMAVLVALGIVAQAGLGIATLLSVTDGRIPILLGVAHQVGAALVFALAILHLSRMITAHASTAPA